MTDKFKKKVRAFAQANGMSYQAAVNHLRMLTPLPKPTTPSKPLTDAPETKPMGG